MVLLLLIGLNEHPLPQSVIADVVLVHLQLLHHEVDTLLHDEQPVLEASLVFRVCQQGSLKAVDVDLGRQLPLESLPEGLQLVMDRNVDRLQQR
jgi:hypothetical protein